MDSPETWQHVAIVFIASIPAVVAAISSLLNGREGRRVKQQLEVTNGHLAAVAEGKSPGTRSASGTAHKTDWYKAPDL